MKWKYTYNKGVNDGAEARAGQLRVSVHRHRHYDPEAWLLSCSPFFDCRVLASKELEEAKLQAVSLVQTTLQDIIDETLKPAE